MICPVLIFHRWAIHKNLIEFAFAVARPKTTHSPVAGASAHLLPPSQAHPGHWEAAAWKQMCCGKKECDCVRCSELIEPCSCELGITTFCHCELLLLHPLAHLPSISRLDKTRAGIKKKIATLRLNFRQEAGWDVMWPLGQLESVWEGHSCRLHENFGVFVWGKGGFAEKNVDHS